MPAQDDQYPVAAPAATVPTAPGVEVRLAGTESAVCALSGDLDIDSLAPAEQALTELVAQRPRRMVVDLREVGFCDSSGLNLLLRARLAAGNADVEFRLAAPSPQVARLLEITGAEAVFSIHETVPAALAS
ncbi:MULTISPECIES: STAS domain-containing protein [unclassified Streptomyces]|uniref:STAS domain-containing protein n=1 Tax=Streptomycetaceae TaxID=2062 RepID=UPI002E7AA0F1|nr:MULTISPECIES: STAS domain-containing protein [unclassified Streptomyces]MED7952901.1 STAS domain-containing protein [Streptomyces sp. BE303]MEE1825144.1 STAS domain-containing protein [Streptomyces sp. BE20]